MAALALTAALSEELLAQMEARSSGLSWPLSLIPGVIESCRIAGLINRGGDLQVVLPAGIWESPNIGVWVFDRELADEEHDKRVNAAAGIALAKFTSLNEGTLWAEALAGCPDLRKIPNADNAGSLRFSWRAD